MQEIIDEANIGRSTFYAHFETKDELLRSMCTDIFHHVFTEQLPQEADHDYSAGSKSLELKLGHIYKVLKTIYPMSKTIELSNGIEYLYMIDKKYPNKRLRVHQIHTQLQVRLYTALNNKTKTAPEHC